MAYDVRKSPETQRESKGSALDTQRNCGNVGGKYSSASTWIRLESDETHAVT